MTHNLGCISPVHIYLLKNLQLAKFGYYNSHCCNEHGTIYAISSDFSDRMTTQSMGLMVLLSEHF